MTRKTDALSRAERRVLVAAMRRFQCHPRDYTARLLVEDDACADLATLERERKGMRRGR